MARKAPRIPGFSIDFPVERLWENERPSWEGNLGGDPLGDDLEGRLWAVRLAIKNGWAPEDAPSSLINENDIRALIDPLELSDPGATVDALRRIAGRHLRPRHMEILGSGPKAIATLLDEIRRNIIQLEETVDRLPLVVRDFLTEAYPMLPRELQNNDRLDLVALERVLPDLGHVVHFVGEALARRRRRPPNILRRQTLLDAADTIETATGSRIRTRWREDDRPCFKFRGEDGMALLKFMKVVEPGVSEMALVKDYRSLRKQATEATPSGK